MSRSVFLALVWISSFLFAYGVAREVIEPLEKLQERARLGDETEARAVAAEARAIIEAACQNQIEALRVALARLERATRSGR